MKFTIEEDFWQIFPQTELAVILLKGIDNSTEGTAVVRSQIDTLLSEGSQKAKQYITADVFSENEVIAVWREAYKKFKTKKGVRCSIEALLRRIDKGTGVGPINPLVDIYNSISLTYGLPCGGEDTDTFAGDLVLTKARGDEPFLALGDEEPETALPEEVVYKDQAGVVCRCWNWRDGQRTMLTEKTKNAFLIIESVDPSRSQDMKAAAQELKRLATELLGGTGEVIFMDSSHRELTVS